MIFDDWEEKSEGLKVPRKMLWDIDLENFREIIKEVHYLSDRNIAFACTVFDLQKEELRCYRRMQLRKKHLLS